jgi:hypothetical protein
LGIGSVRCASTWLHQSLRRHPDVLMTRHKEVTFFGKECLRESLADYRAKFDRPPGELPRIRGDVSPAYARLSARGVAAVRRVLPDARIILVIRNPIDRAWSQALMELTLFEGRHDLSRTPAARLLRRFERRRVTELSDYGPMLDRWAGCFGDALHVETYDRVCADPAAALTAILRHIGADPARLPADADLSRRVWTIGEISGGRSAAPPMPEVVRWYLAMQWREPVRWLNDQLGGRVTHWVNEIEQIAARPAPLARRAHRLANRALLTLPERCAYSLYQQVREWRLARAYARLDRELTARTPQPAAPRAVAPATTTVAAARQLVTRLALAGTIAVVIGTTLALLNYLAATGKITV